MLGPSGCCGVPCLSEGFEMLVLAVFLLWVLTETLGLAEVRSYRVLWLLLVLNCVSVPKSPKVIAVHTGDPPRKISELKFVLIYIVNIEHWIRCHF